MDVDAKTVGAYLRLGGRAPDGALAARLGELTREVRRAIRPARVWRRMSVAEIPHDGTTLLRHLAGCADAYLVCGTLGAGFDALQRRTSVRSGADALIVQAIGTALIERHRDGVEEEIRAELAPGETLLTRYSPGYGVDALQRRLAATSGADALIVQAVGAAFVESWMDETEDAIRAELAPGEVLLTRYSPGYGDYPLAAQRELLALLDAPRAVGVSLTDSLLMVPSKSVSAVIGVRTGSALKSKDKS